MISFKAIGALLDYPTVDLQQAADEIEAALVREQAVCAADLAGIGAFLERLRATDIMDLQEQWVQLFDRSKRLALHLHEHSYGESRDRGQAMVDLALTYRMNGFELAASEMPDYLPLFCEFLSQVPEAPARRYLGEAVDIIEALRVRLAERESTYAPLLGALVSLSTRAVDGEEVTAILSSEPADPQTNEELDAEWAEEPVGFGAGAAMKDCPYSGDIARSRAAEMTAKEAA